VNFLVALRVPLSATRTKTEVAAPLNPGKGCHIIFEIVSGQSALGDNGLLRDEGVLPIRPIGSTLSNYEIFRVGLDASFIWNLLRATEGYCTSVASKGSSLSVGQS
jgi:hypothetical protein